MKFNVWKIKWNRIIIDEAHEIFIDDIHIPNYCDLIDGEQKNGIHTGYGDKAYLNDNQYNYRNNNNDYTKTSRYRIQLYNIDKKAKSLSSKLMFLKGNYKWVLSATSLQNPVINFHSILKWLSSDMDRYIKTIKHNTFNDKAKYLDYDCYKKDYYSYENNLLYYKINNTQIEKFFQNNFRKTSKSDIRGKIDIPIFTEEIVNLTYTTLEKNIYLSALRENNTAKLFMLCTHILISNNNELGNIIGEKGDQILTLTEINELMVKNYKKNLDKTIKEIKSSDTTIENNVKYENICNQILEYFNNKYKYNNPDNEYYLDYNSQRNINNSLQYNYYEQTFFKKNIIGIINLLDEEVSNNIYLIENIIFNENIKNYNLKMKAYMTITIINKYNQTIKPNIKKLKEKMIKDKNEVKRLQNQIKLFESDDFLKNAVEDTCGICFMEYEDKIAITKCRHFVCGDCMDALFLQSNSIFCPYCRGPLQKNASDIRITTVAEIKGDNKEETPVVEVNSKEKLEEEERLERLSKYGTKLAYLIDLLLKIVSNPNDRVIIFSQYDKMLVMIGNILKAFKIKHLYVKGNVFVVNKNITKFKTDDSYKVIMLSSERANSGCNLTEANNILFVDVINADANKTKEIESQAIGRAVRIGQKHPVKITRLIMKDTVEEEYYNKNKYDMSCHQF